MGGADGRDPTTEWDIEPLLPARIAANEYRSFLQAAAGASEPERKLVPLERPLRWLAPGVVCAKLAQLEHALTMRLAGVVLPTSLWGTDDFLALQRDVNACERLHARLCHARPPYHIFGDVVASFADGTEMHLCEEVLRRGLGRVASAAPGLPRLLAIEAGLQPGPAASDAEWAGVPGAVPLWWHKQCGVDELLQFTGTVSRVVNGDLYEVTVRQVLSRPHAQLPLSRQVPQAGRTVRVRLAAVVAPRDYGAVGAERGAVERYGFEVKEYCSAQLQGREVLCAVGSRWRSVTLVHEHEASELDAAHFLGAVLLRDPPELPAAPDGLFPAGPGALSAERVRELLRVTEPRLASGGQFQWSVATALTLLCTADWQQRGKRLHLRQVTPWCRIAPAEDFMIHRPVDLPNCLLARHHLSEWCRGVPGWEGMLPYEWLDTPTDTGGLRKHIRCSLKWVCSKQAILNSPSFQATLRDLDVVRSARLPLPVGMDEADPAPAPVLRATVVVAWRPPPRGGVDLGAEEEVLDEGEAEESNIVAKEAMDEMDLLRGDTVDDDADVNVVYASASDLQGEVVTQAEVDRFRKEQMEGTVFHMEVLIHLLHPAVIKQLEVEAKEERDAAREGSAGGPRGGLLEAEGRARRRMARRWRELHEGHRLPPWCTTAALQRRLGDLVNEVERKKLEVRMCFLDVVDGKVSFFGTADLEKDWDQPGCADRSLHSVLMAGGEVPETSRERKWREGGQQQLAAVLSTVPDDQRAGIAACCRRLNPCTAKLGADFWQAAPRMLQPPTRPGQLYNTMRVISEEMGSMPRLSEINFDLFSLHSGYHAEARPPHPQLLSGATPEEPLLVYDRPNRLSAHLAMLLWMAAPRGELTDQLRSWGCSWEQMDVSTFVFFRPEDGGAAYRVQRTAMNCDRDPELRERYDGRSLRNKWCWKKYRPLLRDLAYHSLTVPLDTPEKTDGVRLNPPGNTKRPADCGYFRVPQSRFVARREELVHHDGAFHLFRCCPLTLGKMENYGPQLPGESPLLRMERMYREAAMGRLEGVLVGSKGIGKKKQPQPGLLKREHRHLTQHWLDIQLQSASGVPVRGAFLGFVAKPATRVAFLYYQCAVTCLTGGSMAQPQLLQHWETTLTEERRYGQPLFRNLLAVWEKIVTTVLGHPQIKGKHVHVQFGGCKFKPTLTVVAWVIPEEELDAKREWEDDRGRARVERFRLQQWVHRHWAEHTAQWTVFLGGAPDVFNLNLDPGRVRIVEGSHPAVLQQMAAAEAAAQAQGRESPPAPTPPSAPAAPGPGADDFERYSDNDEPDTVRLDGGGSPC